MMCQAKLNLFLKFFISCCSYELLKNFSVDHWFESRHHVQTYRSRFHENFGNWVQQLMEYQMQLVRSDFAPPLLGGKVFPAKPTISYSNQTGKFTCGIRKINDVSTSGLFFLTSNMKEGNSCKSGGGNLNSFFLFFLRVLE